MLRHVNAAVAETKKPAHWSAGGGHGRPSHVHVSVARLIPTWSSHDWPVRGMCAPYRLSRNAMNPSHDCGPARFTPSTRRAFSTAPSPVHGDPPAAENALSASSYETG